MPLPTAYTNLKQTWVDGEVVASADLNALEAAVNGLERQAAPVFNVKGPQYGAVGDSLYVRGLVGTAASATVVARNPLPAALAGKTVRLYGMGAAGATKSVVVSSVAGDGLSMTLASNVTTTVGDTAANRYRGEGYYAGTNDTAAIIAAADAAKAAGGGLVYLPAGTYLVDGDLPIHTGVSYRGDGTGATIILLKNAAGTVSVFRSASHALTSDEGGAAANNGGDADWSLGDLTIEGNKFDNATGKYGLLIYGLGYVLSDLLVRNTKSIGIYSEWVPTGGQSPPILGVAAGDMGARWDRIDIADCEGAFKYMGPHDPLMSNIRAFYSGFQADYTTPTFAGVLADLSFSSISGLGSAAGALINNLHVYGKCTTMLKLNSSQMNITNLYVENATGVASTLVDCRLAQNTINGGKLFGDGTSVVDAFVFNSTSADNLVLSGCRISDCRYAFNFFSAVTGTVIRNCSGSTSYTGGVTTNGTVPADAEIDFTATVVGDWRSVRKSGGGPTVANTDFALAAAWGSTATIAVKAGSTVFRGEATVTTGGTGQAASPTMTLTFPQAFIDSPYVHTTRQNGSGGIEVNSYSNATVVFIFNGTPSGTNTYRWAWRIEE